MYEKILQVSDSKEQVDDGERRKIYNLHIYIRAMKIQSKK